MSKKKNRKIHYSKPNGGSTTYTERQKAVHQILTQAAADTYIQFMADISCIVLHDEFGFGAERCRRFHDVLQANLMEWDVVLDDKNIESGYFRSKLDARLKEIGVLDEPFENRYKWIKYRI